MISKPEAYCPRCGGRYTVMDAIDVSRYAETVTYYAECPCGAGNITVKLGTVTAITPRPPIDIPMCFDEPAGTQEVEAWGA